jgi:hypothetical protein
MLLHNRLHQSQSQSQSQNQNQDRNMDTSRRTNGAFGPTQSSWAGSYNDQLPIPSSPVPSAAVPEGMDKRAYLLRSPDPVLMTQPCMPLTQELTDHGRVYSIAETPARPVSGRKRGRQEFQGTPRNISTPGHRATPEGAVSASKTRSVDKAVPQQRVPAQVIEMEDNDQGIQAVGGMAFDEDEDDGDDYFETSMLSVQSAAEERRPPPRPTSTAPSGVSKERRRATIAASDIGIVARMAAAEESEAVAAKRVLPASMAWAAASGQPPRKKKKTAKSTKQELTFAKFLEAKVGAKPRPA